MTLGRSEDDMMHSISVCHLKNEDGDEEDDDDDGDDDVDDDDDDVDDVDERNPAPVEVCSLSHYRLLCIPGGCLGFLSISSCLDVPCRFKANDSVKAQQLT